MEQIICKDLSVGYEGRVILDKLNFTIEQGQYLCILGENGSGKSTLMRTILNLQQPENGSVIYVDKSLKREVGYLSQQTMVQRDFPASVREIVLSGCQSNCRWRPFYNKTDKARADEMMTRLQINNLAGRCYRELSGGQQQRVLLARALCATRKILFMDEPVAGLDTGITKEMYEIIHELNKNEAVTIVMISHDVDEAVSYASHILDVNVPVFYGTKKEYLASMNVNRQPADGKGGKELC